MTLHVPAMPLLRSRRFRALTLGLLLGGVFCLAGAGAALAEYGELIVLEGSATVLRKGISTRVTDRMTLLDADEVRTAPDSKAQIKIAAKLFGADMILGGDSIIKVAEYQADRPTPMVTLIFGGLRSRLNQFFGNRPFVNSQTATIGVKGTDFITTVRRKEATEFIGIEGKIETVSNSNAEHRLLIGQRQWGEIVEGQAPNPPVRVPDEIWIPALRDFAFPEYAFQEQAFPE